MYDKALVAAIEDAAWDCGTKGLDVVQYAYEQGYGHYEWPTGDWVLTRQDLQAIADIFCDNFDAINR